MVGIPVWIDDPPCMTACMKKATTHTVAKLVLTCALEALQEANNDAVRVFLPQPATLQDIV